MSGINPISSSMPSMTTSAVSAPGAAQAAPKADFGDALRGAIDGANADQQTLTSAVGDLMSGQSQDVLGAVTAAAKADLSFKLLIGVRNKVIDAYKQTMNMQI